jgi:NTP pyrophosphatase (non-canonical NTP hydrolase)
MDIKTYTQEAERTTAKLDNELLDNLHYLIGMMTEIGELIDPFKKNMAYEKPIDYVNIQEEVGDLMWYLANFCRINNFDLEKIMQNNIDKLRARYPEKFTSENAINRDLNKERKILEELGF